MSDTETPSQVAQRGNNLIFAAPPSPAHSSGVLAGLVSRLSAARASAQQALLLATEESLEEWAVAAGQVTAGAGLRVLAGGSLSRAAGQLKSSACDLLLVTPDAALDLVRRSALRPAALSALVLAWPELWWSDDALAPLFQDLPKETQRILLTADPGGIDALVERHAWRAPLLGPLTNPADLRPLGRPVGAVSVPWRRRVALLGDLLEQLHRDALVVWTVDQGRHAEIEAALRVRNAAAQLIAGGAPPSGPVVFFDLPAPDVLEGLDAASSPVLLVPPGTEPYVQRWAPERQQIPLPGVLEGARAAMEADRRAIVETIERGVDRGAWLTLAPLLERFDPTTVAVALHRLWSEACAGAGQPPHPTAALSRPSVRVWVGAGRKDEAAAGDFVALLTREGGFSRERIGRIELRETYTLIEFENDSDARRAADALAGRTIRRRRLTARLDRGR